MVKFTIKEDPFASSVESSPEWGWDREEGRTEVNFHAAGSYPKCPLVGVAEEKGS